MPDTLPAGCATSPGGVPPAAPPLPASGAPVSEPQVSSTSDDRYIGEDHDELFGYAHAAEEVGSDGEDGAFSEAGPPNVEGGPTRQQIEAPNSFEKPAERKLKCVYKLRSSGCRRARARLRSYPILLGGARRP